MNKINFSSLGWSFLLPLILIALDCVSGFLNALNKKALNPTKMREGLYKKLTEILLLIVAAVITKGTTLTPLVYNGVAIYICFTEVTSTLNTISSSGIPVPKFLKDLFRGGDV